MLTRTELQIFAAEIRLETIRSIASFGSGHIGGALSIADLLSVLYGNIVNSSPEKSDDITRDWVVLSKGHCGPALYAVLALKGYFPKEELKTLNREYTHLPSHCDRNLTPGVDVSTGSLGQGASCAAGVAFGAKLNNIENYIYLILGDGECNEGQVWEMAMFSAQQNLDNLIAFVDWNHQQLDGDTKDICNMHDIAEKFRAFRWQTDTVNGHDVTELENAIKAAKASKGRPHAIIMDTAKGKGWSQTESKITGIHHISITKDMEKEAFAEFGAYIEKLRNS